jgi:hypothetical protein
MPQSNRPLVAIAFHSGYGHTAVLADAVVRGATDAGAESVLIAVDTITGPLQAAVRLPLFLGTASAGPGEDVGAVSGLGQVHQMGAFGLVELEGAGDGFEDGR